MRNAWFRSAFLSLTCAGVLCAQTLSDPAQTTPAAILTHLDATSAQILYHDRNDHAVVLDFVLTTTTQKAQVKEQDTVCISYIDRGADHVAQSIEIYPTQGYSGPHAIPGGVGGVSMLTEPPVYSREGAEALELAKLKSNAATLTATAKADALNKQINSLNSTVNTLDNYKQVADVSLTFGFDKWALTKDDKLALDSFAKQLETANGYFLEVIGGTDATVPAQHNYDLSKRRTNAVVDYLGSKYGIAAHRFVLGGIRMDEEASPNAAPDGREQNRRVEIRLLMKASDMGTPPPPG